MKASTGTRSLIVTAACGFAVAFIGAGTASAGENNANGRETGAPSHANSICAFSGQNDTIDDETEADFGQRVQSWGQDVRNGRKAELTAIGFAPGTSCNGATGFLSDGGGEP